MECPFAGQVSPSSSPATTALATSRGSLVQACCEIHGAAMHVQTLNRETHPYLRNRPVFRHDENFVLPAVYTKISGTLVIPLARLWHLQKKRVLRPQRVTLAAVIGAPGGAVLHQPGHLCAVVYMLTENASLLNEHFDASLEGIAVGFKYDEKRFKENWAAYLTREDVTDSTLLETYRVICRVGPPPRYIKTLLGCGEAENCLKSDGKFPASSGSCRYALVQCDCSQHQQSGPFGMAWRKQLTRS